MSTSQPPRRRRLEVVEEGDVTVVNFIDRKILDEQNIQKIGEDLFSLVDELGRKKILLNFGNVEYLSSAALGKFITLNKKVRPPRASSSCATSSRTSTRCSKSPSLTNCSTSKKRNKPPFRLSDRTEIRYNAAGDVRLRPGSGRGGPRGRRDARRPARGAFVGGRLPDRRGAGTRGQCGVFYGHTYCRLRSSCQDNHPGSTGSQ